MLNAIREGQNVLDEGLLYNPPPAVILEMRRVNAAAAMGEPICHRYKNGLCWDPFCRMAHPSKPMTADEKDIITLVITAGGNAMAAFIRAATKEEDEDEPKITFRYVIRCHMKTPVKELEAHMNERLVSNYFSLLFNC